jgi:hypothetical protein
MRAMYPYIYIGMHIGTCFWHIFFCLCRNTMDGGWKRRGTLAEVQRYLLCANLLRVRRPPGMSFGTGFWRNAAPRPLQVGYLEGLQAGCLKRSDAEPRSFGIDAISNFEGGSSPTREPGNNRLLAILGRSPISY